MFNFIFPKNSKVTFKQIKKKLNAIKKIKLKHNYFLQIDLIFFMEDKNENFIKIN